MAGTKAGAAKAAVTNRERHGADFYRSIGSLGGKAPTTKPKGFAANKDLAKSAGRLGGLISRRTKKVVSN